MGFHDVWELPLVKIEFEFFQKMVPAPHPHTNGIWGSAVDITGKIAVTATSGISGLAVLVQ